MVLWQKWCFSHQPWQKWGSLNCSCLSFTSRWPWWNSPHAVNGPKNISGWKTIGAYLVGRKLQNWMMGTPIWVKIRENGSNETKTQITYDRTDGPSLLSTFLKYEIDIKHPLKRCKPFRSWSMGMFLGSEYTAQICTILPQIILIFFTPKFSPWHWEVGKCRYQGVKLSFNYHPILTELSQIFKKLDYLLQERSQDCKQAFGRARTG